MLVPPIFCFRSPTHFLFACRQQCFCDTSFGFSLPPTLCYLPCPQPGLLPLSGRLHTAVLMLRAFRQLVQRGVLHCDVKADNFIGTISSLNGDWAARAALRRETPKSLPFHYNNVLMWLGDNDDSWVCDAPHAVRSRGAGPGTPEFYTPAQAAHNEQGIDETQPQVGPTGCGNLAGPWCCITPKPPKRLTAGAGCCIHSTLPHLYALSATGLLVCTTATVLKRNVADYPRYCN